MSDRDVTVGRLCAVIVVAGTRGDVSPAVLLAKRLAAAAGNIFVSILTHASHRDWITRELEATAVLYLPWSSQQHAAAALQARGSSITSEPEVWQECFESCQCWLRNQTPSRSLIIHNLFALEAFHIAEALGVRSIAMSPTLMPQHPPASFQRRFERRLPLLYAELQQYHSGRVTWADVEHWMWPLFSDRWLGFRISLGLPPNPQLRMGSQLMPAPVLLYGIPEQIVPKPRSWPEHAPMCGFWAIPLAKEGDQLWSSKLGSRLQHPAKGVTPANPGSVAIPQQTVYTLPSSSNVQPARKKQKLEDAANSSAASHCSPSAHQDACTNKEAHLADRREALLPFPNDKQSSLPVGEGAVLPEECDLLLPRSSEQQTPVQAVADAASQAHGTAAERLQALGGREQDIGRVSSAARCQAADFSAATPGCRCQLDPPAEPCKGQLTSPQHVKATASPSETRTVAEQDRHDGGGSGKQPGEGQSSPTRASLICISFGSVGRMGLLGDAADLAHLLITALNLLKQPTILLTGGWDALEKAVHDAAAVQPCLWLLAVEDFVSHAWLLPRCSAMLHAASVGAVAAATIAGIPQLSCPLHFDQYFWADKMVWMGCGDRLPAGIIPAPPQLQDPPDKPPAVGHLLPATQQDGSGFSPQAVDVASAALEAQLQSVSRRAALLTDALQAVQRSSVQESAAALASSLAGEDGVAAAVDIIRQQLSQAAVIPEASAEDHSSTSCRQPKCANYKEARDVGYRHLTRIDYACQAQCYWHHTFSLRPGAVIFDVGANIGLFSMWVMQERLRGANCRLVAIEPLPPNQQLLRANLQQAGFWSQVELVGSAVGNASCASKDFTYYPSMPGNSTALPVEKLQLQGSALAAHHWQKSTAWSCAVQTLTAVALQVRVNHIDLLKIDAEGMELDVLHGIEEALWPCIHQVVMEVHEVPSRLQEVTCLLYSHGFAVHQSKGGAPATTMMYAVRT
ncbi:hypothetical protein WJX74_005493 [Apatococcus lobatus]|uniref:Methyltransferase FkbM domain-containing protein n=1 Tax=Apatococcus lobatus TaxID=904363 RepID=A0AAW1QYI2_9CHLO